MQGFGVKKVIFLGDIINCYRYLVIKVSAGDILLKIKSNNKGSKEDYLLNCNSRETFAH